MKVIVIGAAGRIGSHALASCLKRGFETTAFVRTPSKIPSHLREYKNLKVVQGDATDEEALVTAISGQDAVIQAAVYGSNLPIGSQEGNVQSQKVVSTVISAAVRVQKASDHSPPLRFWNVAGQVLMDVPGYPGKIQGDIIPLHPEHYANYEYLVKNGDVLDWSVICPGKVDEGEPSGPQVISTDKVPLWSEPSIIGRIPVIGPILNVIYNWTRQKVTYSTIGEFLADHLGPGGELSKKRVGLLEDLHATK